MVSAPPIGSHPRGFWAQMECVFLNTYQARWQYVADTIGLGFAQGKTLFYRRSDIEAAGGLRVLAAEAAEDAASTKIMRAAASACAWSMRRSSSRSASARAPTSGTGRCAGRGCGATASLVLLPGDRRRHCAAARSL